MRRTRYPSALAASTKKDHPAKINLTKKLASRSALTRRKPRLPVKFFPLYDTTIFYAFSRQASRSRGLCGCQPTQYQPNDTMNTTSTFRLLLAIRREGDLALSSGFKSSPLWRLARRRNQLNVWRDDAGTEYVSIGAQM
jgi:hypothetical protein